MRTIHFKNGDKREITQEIAQTVCDNLLDGCNVWQSFSDDNNKVLFIVNLSEVTYIDYAFLILNDYTCNV